MCCADAFLRMGASLERVSVMPIGTQTLERALQCFLKFDVSLAECYADRDKQHLLGIIEAGFGTFLAFNRTVQCLLIARADGVQPTGSDDLVLAELARAAQDGPSEREGSRGPR